MFILFILVLIVIALAFVNLPLFRKSQPGRDKLTDSREAMNLETTRQQIQDIENEVENDLIAEDQLTSIRTEAENTLLMEMQTGGETVQAEKSARFHRVTALVLSIFVPAMALLIYLSVGTPGALVETTEDITQPSMQQLLSNLEQRLADNPGDQEGWLVLAQTNMMLQNFDKAVVAMEKLYQLAGDSPDVMARYADTLTMANDGRFTAKAIELIEKTLKLDPAHVHGLWLAGVQAFQAENFNLAVSLFQKARANITDPENLAQIDELIRTAKDKSGVEPDTPNTQTSQEPATMVAVKVRVELSEQLKEKVKSDQTVFIFAKAATGPPMPLAVSKHLVSELPVEVSLDDSMAMMQELKLSSFDQVIISARISNSGQPLAQSGDLQGESQVINPQSVDQVSISINQVVE